MESHGNVKKNLFNQSCCTILPYAHGVKATHVRRASKRDAVDAADEPEPPRRGNKVLATKTASARTASGEAWSKAGQLKRETLQNRLAQRVATLAGKTTVQTKQATKTAISTGKVGFSKAAQISRDTVLPEISRTGSWLWQRIRRERLKQDYRDFLVWLHESVLDVGAESLFFAPTKGYLPLDSLTIESGNRAFGHDYRPSPRFVFEWAISAIPEDLGKFSFVDYGAGKGRVMLLASQHEFKTIGGMEFAAELHDAATMNIQQFPRSRMTCRNVECTLADAAYVGLPEDETIYYFYNPFSREVLAAVLEIITASYHERPRRLYVVLVDSSDGDLVMQTGIFGRLKMSWFDRLRARLLSPYPIAIYRSLA